MSFSETLKVTVYVLDDWDTIFGTGRDFFYTYTCRLGAWPKKPPIKSVPAQLSPLIKSIRD